VPLVQDAAGATDAGPRATNEDACLVDRATGLFVVADGMGGHNAGEVASALAVTTIAEAMGTRTQPADRLIEAAVRKANARILEEASKRPDCAGMGTTVTALLVGGADATLVNVGDSRAYLLREGRLEQLTRDDSWVRQLQDDGVLLSEADIQRHPMRHVLTEVVGVRPDLLPRAASVALHGGDLVLLASDGLHGALADTELQSMLSGEGSCEELARDLVGHAVKRGATDNVTAVVVRVVDDGSRA
jgi:PPM family protein phosphatase